MADENGETTEQRPSELMRRRRAAAATMLREFLITSTGRTEDEKRRRDGQKSVIIAVSSLVRKSQRERRLRAKSENGRAGEEEQREGGRPRMIPTRKRFQIEREVSGKTIRRTLQQRRNKLQIPFLPNVESKLKINGRRGRGKRGSEMMLSRKGIPAYPPIGSDKIDEA